MILKKMRACLLVALALLLLASLVGCSASRAVRASSNATRAVATAGNLQIPYENFYYLAMTRIAEMKEEYGEAVFDDPDARASLEKFVTERLFTRSEALLSLADDYGLDVGKGELGDSVDEEMKNIIEGDFGGDRKAYIASLDAAYLTDHYVRTYIAVENYLAIAVVEEMIKKGELDVSDETARARIEGEDFIRTVHVFISKNKAVNPLYSDEENRRHIASLYETISGKENDLERYRAMCNAIGGKYNNDIGDTLGNGYYFTRGEMQEAYETAAFALAEYGVSAPLETEDGYYLIMRLPKEAAYIEENFEELKGKSYLVALNRKVEERLENTTVEMTKFGAKLDLLALPAVRAGGGEALPVVLGVTLGVIAVALVTFFVLRRRKTKKAAKK